MLYTDEELNWELVILTNQELDEPFAEEDLGRRDTKKMSRAEIEQALARMMRTDEQDRRDTIPVPAMDR